MTQEGQDQSPEQEKPVINSEDIKNIEDFYSHFQIDIPDHLQKELDYFKQNQDQYTLADQERLKISMAQAIAQSNHELFQDELFTVVRENCSKVFFDAQFDRDLEQALTEDQEDDSGSGS